MSPERLAPLRLKASQKMVKGLPLPLGLSGAQPPEAFLEIFEAARREADQPEAEAV